MTDVAGPDRDTADTEPSTPARVYDVWLGGTVHRPSDRTTARDLAAVVPLIPVVIRESRAFLHRGVRAMVQAGLRQFLDLGAGITEGGATHEIVQAVDPDISVAYMDSDPVAVAHSRTLLRGNEYTAVVQGDLMKPERVLTDPAVRGLIDFSRPVGLVLSSVLHFVPDDADPVALVRGYLAGLAPGSQLLISHLCPDTKPGDFELFRALYPRTTPELIARSRQRITELFDGVTLLDPGVVPVGDWRPDPGVSAPEPTGLTVGGLGVVAAPSA